MKKKIILAVSLLSVISLTGCNSNLTTSEATSATSVATTATTSVEDSTVATSENEPELVQEQLGFDIICPQGAPGLALSTYLAPEKDSQRVQIGSPLNCVAALKKGDANMVIFDSIKGTGFIESGVANYKLASILTAGNAYVLSTGNDDNDTIDTTDSIVSFGPGSMFNQIFKDTYGIDELNVKASTAEAYTVAVTGKDAGEDVDYVLVAEPYVSQALSENTEVTVKANLKTAWAAYSKSEGLNGGLGYEDFPQAGVFISNQLEENTDVAVQANIANALAIIDQNAADLVSNDGANVLATIDKDTTDGIYDATSTYGMDNATLHSVIDSDENVNGVTNALAFHTGNYDVNSFLNGANLEGFTAFDTSVFSTYYNA